MSEQNVDRSIGEIIREHGNLTAEDVERVLAYQRQHGVRFGEAAVALGLASSEQVMAALSEQFSYPLAASKTRDFAEELVVLSRPFTAQAEALRAIRSRLLMADGGGAGKSLAVVSPDGGDGKSYFAANLAASLAQLGRRTLLIDADLRNPRQHEIFGIENSAGLSGILAGRKDLQPIKVVEGMPSLYVMPAGGTPPNPLELIERAAFEAVLSELSTRFDQIIVDTPAASLGSDALVAASRCGYALVVARRNTSRLAALRDLTSALSFASAKVLGLIYNEYDA
jgi:protein-tyrosine kinase